MVTMGTEDEHRQQPEQASDDDMPLALALDDDPDLRSRIGRYLGGVRKLQKISQEQVARDLRMSRPHLSNIEMGHSRTSWKILRELGRYYNYSMRTLIEEAQQNVPSRPAPLRRSAKPRSPLGERLMDAVKSVEPKVDDALSRASSDEAFLVGLMFLLDAQDRKIIAEQILERVQARIKRASLQ